MKRSSSCAATPKIPALEETPPVTPKRPVKDLDPITPQRSASRLKAPTPIKPVKALSTSPATRLISSNIRILDQKRPVRPVRASEYRPAVPAVQATTYSSSRRSSQQQSTPKPRTTQSQRSCASVQCSRKGATLASKLKAPTVKARATQPPTSKQTRARAI